MKIRTFSGPSEERLRREILHAFGRDAIVLSTRRVKRGGVWGLVGRTVLSIEACDGRDLARMRNTSPGSAQASRPESLRAPPAAASQEGRIAQGEILRELQALKSSIAEIAGKVGERGVPDFTPELQEAYRVLIENEVAHDLACSIVRQINERASREQLREPESLRSCLRKAIEEMLPTAGPIELCEGRARRIVFVGPTGVGKTTTIAKIAAQMSLKDRYRVGLITIDTYRLGAVEQLRTFAGILKIPIEVADTPRHLTRLIEQFSGFDVVLIDTAGRSQHDPLRVNELKTFIDAAKADEVHLVMSLTSNAKNLCRVVETFVPLGASRIVLTKLDEVDSFGLLVNVMSRVNRTLSYVTFGQDIPDDIELGRAASLAKLVLGEEALPGMKHSVPRGIA